MARNPISAQSLPVSTGAIVTCKNPRYWNENQEFDPDSVFMEMDIAFNGEAGSLGDFLVFSRSATLTQKQAAVRARVNVLLLSIEVGATSLNNANIQIVGLPV